MRDQKNECRTCKHWDECGAEQTIRFGMCRRFPPQYCGPTSTTPAGWSHPVTTEYLDCGEWTPANPQPATDDELFAAGVLVRQQPDLLPVLENLLAEFDRYDAAMAEIGRGHEDYGGQRAAARVAILQAKKGR